MGNDTIKAGMEVRWPGMPGFYDVLETGIVDEGSGEVRARVRGSGGEYVVPVEDLVAKLVRVEGLWIAVDVPEAHRASWAAGQWEPETVEILRQRSGGPVESLRIPGSRVDWDRSDFSDRDVRGDGSRWETVGGEGVARLTDDECAWMARQ